MFYLDQSKKKSSLLFVAITKVQIIQKMFPKNENGDKKKTTFMFTLFSRFIAYKFKMLVCHS